MRADSNGVCACSENQNSGSARKINMLFSVKYGFTVKKSSRVNFNVLAMKRCLLVHKNDHFVQRDWFDKKGYGKLSDRR